MKTYLLTIGALLLAVVHVAFADFIPLPAEQAFQFSATLKDAKTLIAHWDITPGYYLYKDRISFKLIDSEDVSLGVIKKPQGIFQQDALLGNYQVYDGSVEIVLPLEYTKARQLTLIACFQGCSFSHFCYPPVTKEISFNPHKDVGKTLESLVVTQTVDTVKPLAEAHDPIRQLFATHSGAVALLSFFGFGLLLAFTPCVLPMIPILSGIILGHEKGITPLRGFLLSLTYVAGMAITYAIVGIVAGFIGQSLQVAMQNPWVIASFSALFVVLSLSLFGLFEIRLPGRFEENVFELSNKQKSGSYLGVAAMGILSTLIVSPCVTAPLIGALTYIGETHDAFFGGLALFVLSLGMGAPLLIIGTFGGKFLPRVGQWMEHIKALFGVLLLAVAIWMLSRIIPAQITLVLWGALFIICAVFMGLLNNKPGWGVFWRGLGLVFTVYGILLMIGAAMGNTDPLKPLANFNGVNMEAVQQETLFTRIKTPADLAHQLNAAKNQHQLTMLDFYADWCIACKDMQRTTFSDPRIQSLLKQHFVLLQADVTSQDKMDKILEKQLNVIAPPTVLFFDEDGHELQNERIVGEMGPDAFKARIEHLIKRKGAQTTGVSPNLS